MTTPSLAEVIMQAIESRLIDIHTALPGKVNSYNAETQTAEVQLQVKRAVENKDGILQTEELPVLQNVPVAFPRSTRFFVSFPLDEGDFVLVMFAESSIDQWRSKGDLVGPGDARRHTLTGAIALPCCYPTTEDLDETHDSAMVIGQNGEQRIFIHENGDVEVTDDDDGDADTYVASADQVYAELVKIGTAIGFLGGSYTPPTQSEDIGCTNLKADD